MKELIKKKKDKVEHNVISAVPNFAFSQYYRESTIEIKCTLREQSSRNKLAWLSKKGKKVRKESEQRVKRKDKMKR